MEPPVYLWLNVASVNAFVSGRIYGQGHIPDSPTYPYIRYQVVSGAAQNMLSEAPEVDNDRTQVDCWSRDRTEVVQLAAAVRTELDKRGHQLVKIGPTQDPETKSYRVQFDYSFWTHR